MKFTKSQQNAISYGPANLQLIACAGSGKTEVVARRVAHLLRPDGGSLAPRNIVAFTFTDKAADGTHQTVSFLSARISMDIGRWAQNRPKSFARMRTQGEHG